MLKTTTQTVVVCRGGVVSQIQAGTTFDFTADEIDFCDHTLPGALRGPTEDEVTAYSAG